MQTETKYGEILFYSILTSKEAATRRVIFLVMTLCILGGSAFAFHSTGGFDPDALNPVGVLLILASIPFFIRIFTMKASEVAVFEHGLMHIYKSKRTEMAFEDIAGIRDLTEKTTFFAVIVPFFAYRSRVITINKKDGTVIELSKNQARYFDEFGDIFNAVFTGHLLNGVTKETVGQAYISFGPQLELINGQLEFVQGEDGKRVIPLDAVLRVQPDGDGRSLLIMGKADEKSLATLAAIKTETALNTEALYSILEMVRQQ
ncbi:MAG: hypothetical protein FWD03_05130 [Defluviitaleaceae bacterium]|nr:hypothetical protein [Defluviitaleaceae bacterium]